MEQITHRINALREAAGLSEARLADSSAIPRTTLKRRLIEPAAFTLSEIERLAGVLGADPRWLWRGDDAA